MRVKINLIMVIILVIIISGCSAVPTAVPTAAPLWDERLNATARAVVAATFFAPTHTPTPTQTSTITLTPTPTPVTPTATPTLTRAFCIPPDSTFEKGQVKRVIDGETILVEIDGKEQQVRYIGISAPKDLVNFQLFGKKATSVNEDLVTGQSVRLYKDAAETDRAGRLLRYVYAGSIFVNEELVRLGLATVVSDPPNTACFAALLEAEREASQKNVGMWSRSAPTQTPLGYGLEKMTEVPCNCYGRELNCIDFPHQLAAQACYNYCKSLGLGDLFDLAVGTNGRACTGLP